MSVHRAAGSAVCVDGCWHAPLASSRLLPSPNSAPPLLLTDETDLDQVENDIGMLSLMFPKREVRFI